MYRPTWAYSDYVIDGLEKTLTISNRLQTYNWELIMILCIRPFLLSCRAHEYSYLSSSCCLNGLIGRHRFPTCWREALVYSDAGD